jgi:hypothetical protein
MEPINQTMMTRLTPKFCPMIAPAWHTASPNPRLSVAQLKSSSADMTLTNHRIMRTFQIANAQADFRHFGISGASSLWLRSPGSRQFAG